ncbi:MAG: PsbP-related protein [Candidatus Pacebacteria bacterium]|nr:PsbP-related protein [Candidatus Paceibacterota bacterium]
MKNYKKGFIVPLLLAIIVLLVVGGGVYIYQNKKTETPATDLGIQQSNQVKQNISVKSTTPTPKVSTQTNPTVGWKTYQNKMQAYEIKYPANWIVSNEPGSPIVNFCGPEYKTVDDCSGGGLNNSPVISIRNDMTDIRQDGYCSQDIGKGSIFCSSFIQSRKNITIDGRDATIVDFQDVNGGSVEVFLKKTALDEKAYNIETVGLKNNPVYRSVFLQMLPTFKFTK